MKKEKKKYFSTFIIKQVLYFIWILKPEDAVAITQISVTMFIKIAGIWGLMWIWSSRGVHLKLRFKKQFSRQLNTLNKHSNIKTTVNWKLKKKTSGMSEWNQWQSNKSIHQFITTNININAEQKITHGNNYSPLMFFGSSFANIDPDSHAST